MHRRSSRRRLPFITFVVSLAAASAVGAGTSSIAAAKPKHHHHHATHHKRTKSLAGTWTGSYSGKYTGTFKLKWKQSGSHLTGSIMLSNPSGTFGCTGTVHRGHIKFGAVSAGATYTGTVSGRSMSGTYKTKKGGGSWKAHKSR